MIKQYDSLSESQKFLILAILEVVANADEILAVEQRFLSAIEDE